MQPNSRLSVLRELHRILVFRGMRRGLLFVTCIVLVVRHAQILEVMLLGLVFNGLGADNILGGLIGHRKIPLHISVVVDSEEDHWGCDQEGSED